MRGTLRTAPSTEAHLLRAVPPQPAQSDRPLPFAESAAGVRVFADRDECGCGPWTEM